MLLAQGLSATVLDHDTEMIETVRAFGYRVFYGDATRLDLLRTAGAAKARILVLSVDDVEQSLKIVDLVKEHFPQLQIVARARDVTHWNALRDRGVMRAMPLSEASAISFSRSLGTTDGMFSGKLAARTHLFQRHGQGVNERAGDPGLVQFIL